MMHEQTRLADVFGFPTPEEIGGGMLEEIAARHDPLDERLERVLFTMQDLAARWHVDEATACTVATCADAYHGGLCVTSAGEWVMEAAAVLDFERRNPEVRAAGCSDLAVALLRALREEATREGYELRLAH